MNQKPAMSAYVPTGKGITAITPTGDRPLAFALCQKWMMNQTVKPDQWLVIDDGKIPMTPYAPMEYVRREPKPTDPKHTLLLNLRAAMPLIKGDKIIIIEDDEYYAPGYVAEMARRLNQHKVIGICRSKYYHLPSGGYSTLENIRHASLAQMAFKRSFLPEFEELLNKSNDPYLDIRIWQKIRNRGYLFVDIDKPLYLGIKGLPGRAGIGGGHRPATYGGIKDTEDRSMLKKWVPQDYQVYLDILSGKLTNENHQSYFPGITQKI